MYRLKTVHYIRPVNGLVNDWLEINQGLIKDFTQ